MESEACLVNARGHGACLLGESRAICMLVACEAMEHGHGQEACLVGDSKSFVARKAMEAGLVGDSKSFVAREAMEAGLVGDSKSFIACEAMEHGHGHGQEACLVGKSSAHRTQIREYNCFTLFH